MIFTFVKDGNIPTALRLKASIKDNVYDIEYYKNNMSDILGYKFEFHCDNVKTMNDKNVIEECICITVELTKQLLATLNNDDDDDFKYYVSPNTEIETVVGDVLITTEIEFGIKNEALESIIGD